MLRSLDAQLLDFASSYEISVFVWGIAFSRTHKANESRAWKVLRQRLFQREVVTVCPRGVREALLPHVLFGR